MKKLIGVTLIAVMLITGCGLDKRIDGTEYETRGLINGKQECINYEIAIGNVIWGALLFETVAAPVYFFGFSIWNPTSKKKNCEVTE